MFDTDRTQLLLRLAREEIAKQFGSAVHDHVPRSAWLNEPGATFVTLTLHGKLRGCIGSLEAHRPLIDDVRANALAAAFRDPRFHRLTKEEFADIAIEISLLSAPEPIDCTSEADALAQLRPGEDGVILSYGQFHATFLPQVWGQLPYPELFISHLKSKAGLPENFWAADIRLSRYSVQKLREGGHHG